MENIKKTKGVSFKQIVEIMNDTSDSPAPVDLEFARKVSEMLDNEREVQCDGEYTTDYKKCDFQYC